MKTTNTKKLSVNVETVKSLDAGELQSVNGGTASTVVPVVRFAAPYVARAVGGWIGGRMFGNGKAH